MSTTAEEIIERLQSVHLFSALQRPQLRALAPLVREIEYPQNHVICRQGEHGDRYYIVEEGSLSVTRVDTEGRALEVLQLEPGDAFGETSLLLGDVRDATVQTVEHTLLLYLTKDDFDLLLEKEPQIERLLHMRRDITERRNYPQFSWLEAGELPIKVLTKHVAVLIPALIIPGLVGLILIVGTITAFRMWGPFALVVGIILTLVPTAIALYFYIDWRNDIYVVTNRRVIDREQVGLIRERFSAVPLRAIQDIQQVRIGLLAHILRFGDLVVDTAGTAEGQVVFRSIPNPERVRDTIFEQRERTQALARAQERSSIEQAMRHHFLGEGHAPAKPATEEPEQARRWGCLAMPIDILRYFLPPTWHREGSTITWRKHWMGLIRTVGIPLIVFGLITTVVLVVLIRVPNLRASMTVLYSIAAFILVPWLLWQFDDWQNDFYQVTASRIVHVDRLPFFLREERREANLEQVTNIRFEQSFWGRILGYGDVIVETAAPAGTFHFQMASQPRKVQGEIFAHIEAARQRKQKQNAERHRAELLDWFSIYDEIRQDRPDPSPQEEQQEESE